MGNSGSKKHMSITYGDHCHVVDCQERGSVSDLAIKVKDVCKHFGLVKKDIDLSTIYFYRTRDDPKTAPRVSPGTNLSEIGTGELSFLLRPPKNVRIRCDLTNATEPVTYLQQETYGDMEKTIENMLITYRVSDKDQQSYNRRKMIMKIKKIKNGKKTVCEMDDKIGDLHGCELEFTLEHSGLYEREDLRELCKNQNLVFIGKIAVGKSALINTFIKALNPDGQHVAFAKAYPEESGTPGTLALSAVKIKFGDGLVFWDVPGHLTNEKGATGHSFCQRILDGSEMGEIFGNAFQAVDHTTPDALIHVFNYEDLTVPGLMKLKGVHRQYITEARKQETRMGSFAVVTKTSGSDRANTDPIDRLSSTMQIDRSCIFVFDNYDHLDPLKEHSNQADDNIVRTALYKILKSSPTCRNAGFLEVDLN